MPRRGRRRSPRATDKQMKALHAVGFHFHKKPSRKLASTLIRRANAGVYAKRGTHPAPPYYEAQP